MENHLVNLAVICTTPLLVTARAYQLLGSAADPWPHPIHPREMFMIKCTVVLCVCVCVT